MLSMKNKGLQRMYCRLTDVLFERRKKSHDDATKDGNIIKLRLNLSSKEGML